MVLTEMKNRGVEDIFIICVDGLKGFSEAIEGIYPDTQVQLCVVHMIRNSLRYVSWKDRKSVVEALKPIYTAANAEAAKESLKAFRQQWDDKYPTIGDIWERNWQGIIPFLAYPDYIRKAITAYIFCGNTAAPAVIARPCKDNRKINKDEQPL